MRKIIPRIEKWTFPKTGGWFVNGVSENDIHMGEAIKFLCPECNGYGDIPLHSIDSNGEVNASILCNCGKYHEYVIFDEWDKNTFKKAGEKYIEKI